MSPCSRCPSETWITAAFRTVRDHESFLFMKKECALYYCDVGCRPNEKILRQPTPLTKVFPTLRGTIFEEAGVQCAVASHYPGRAFLFAYNECAEFSYAPYGGDDKIEKGPIPIAQMFPFLGGTVFENGVDAAIDTSIKFETYLFMDDQCALIDYGFKTILSKGSIRDLFPVLRGTGFETGFDAALSIHDYPNQAFLFKGDTYVRISYNPGKTTNQNIICGPEKIKVGRPVLATIVPRKNLKAN